MHWIVDLLLLASVIIGLIWGANSGLLNVSFATLGILIGWWLADWFPYFFGVSIITEAIVWLAYWIVERYADDIVLFLQSIAILDSMVPIVVSYLVIMILAVVSLGKVLELLEPTLPTNVRTPAGTLERIGGLFLGFIVGLVIASAIIVVLTRIAFGGVTPSSTGSAPTIVAAFEKQQVGLANSLSRSKLVPVVSTIREPLPDSMSWFVPNDFDEGITSIERHSVR